jgi:hypothetical protein
MNAANKRNSCIAQINQRKHVLDMYFLTFFIFNFLNKFLVISTPTLHPAGLLNFGAAGPTKQPKRTAKESFAQPLLDG